MTQSSRSYFPRFGSYSLKKYLIAALILAIYPASAGGPGWLVEVVGIERIDKSHAVIKLKNASDQIHEPLQVCDPLVVTADYNGELWPKTWTNEVSEKVHSDALDAVTRKMESGQEFMFGYVGTGLVHESVRLTCYVVTRGLMFDSESGLIAFHDRI